MSAPADSWSLAATAVRLLLSGAPGLGGAVIRLRAGPARDAVLAALAPLSARKMHPGITREQLLGGIDLTATLESGQVIENKGFLTTARCIALTMAERAPQQLAALLAQAIDTGHGPLLLALDEGAEPDEGPPPALADRLAFHLAPDGRVPPGWIDSLAAVPAGTVGARDVTSSDADVEALTVLAARCGIDSLRAPLLALATARAHGALQGRTRLMTEDLQIAAALVLAPRAKCLPEPPMDQPEDSPPPPPEEGESAGEDETTARADGDILVDAVRTALPGGVLAGLVPAGTGRGSGSGAGARRKGNRKGRPLPSRPGRPDGQNRIDIVATLRAAAPWQPLRRATVPAGTRLAIRPSDLRVRRFEEHSDRLLIFTVDASGSAALARLNEAKGAVETLLAEAYSARDHVALIAFRGTGAELLLPPTRSLVQTKRRLASLPGGGGTPLATGLQEALMQAKQARTKGLTPTVVLLTDGRSNIALDGTANRAQAAADTGAMARALKADKTGALVIDMSARPQETLRALSVHLGAPYIALPRADAAKLAGAVNVALSR
ncbi:MAG: magnesium chelatase subunit D [Pseudomonadota bacterium]